MKMSIAHKNISEETRRKMSIASIGRVPWNKGRKLTVEQKMAKWKAVSQFDKCGKWLSNYTSVNEASQMTGILKSSISNCLNGRGMTAGGFVWKYLEVD